MHRLDERDPVVFMGIGVVFFLFVIGALIKSVSRFLVDAMHFLLLLPIQEFIAKIFPVAIVLLIVSWVVMIIIRVKGKSPIYINFLSFPVAYVIVTNIANRLIDIRNNMSLDDNSDVLVSVLGVVFNYLLIAGCILVVRYAQRIVVGFFSSILAPRLYYDQLKSYGRIVKITSVIALFPLLFFVLVSFRQTLSANIGIIVLLLSVPVVLFLIGVVFQRIAFRAEGKFKQEILDQLHNTTRENELLQQTRYCGNCGKQLVEGSRFCHVCGKSRVL